MKTKDRLIVKLSKILLVFCTLFSQLSFSLEVFAEENGGVDPLSLTPSSENDLIKVDVTYDSNTVTAMSNGGNNYLVFVPEGTSEIGISAVVSEGATVEINNTATTGVVNVNISSSSTNIPIDVTAEDTTSVANYTLDAYFIPSISQYDYNNDGTVDEGDIDYLFDDSLFTKFGNDTITDADISKIQELVSMINDNVPFYKTTVANETVGGVKATATFTGLNNLIFKRGDSVLADSDTLITGDKIYFDSTLLYSVFAPNTASIDITGGTSASLSNSSTIYNGDATGVQLKFDKDVNVIYGTVNSSSLLSLNDVSVNGYGVITNDGKFIYFINPGMDNTITFNFNSSDVGVANVVFSDLKVYSNDVNVAVSSDIIGTDIEVIAPGKGGDVKPVVSETTNSEEETVSSTTVGYISKINPTYVSLSSDNYIKSLVIKGYNIDFDMYTSEYNINVNNNVRALDLDITLNDENASYEVKGNKNFKVGKNKVEIIVTAEDGSERVYSINVNRKNKTEAKADSNSNGSSNVTKTVIIVLIVLVIVGLIYVIFKDDEEDIQIIKSNINNGKSGNKNIIKDKDNIKNIKKKKK